MPRIRSLKPEIVSDVKLNRISMPAELTFYKMITQADDIGLLAGAHRQLLGTLYPLREDVTVAVLLAWLEELVDVGIVRWLETRDGVPVLQIANWARHQRVDNAGRSQLGALLKDPSVLADNPDLSTSEVRGGSPQSAASRGLDHLPPTKDQGSPTKDQGSPTKDHRPTADEVAAAAIALSIQANRGLREHAARPQLVPRIIATNARTYASAEAILLAGVPLAFAESLVYELAQGHNAEGEVKSLKYFVDATIRAWTEDRATVASSGSGPPRTNGRKHSHPSASPNPQAEALRILRDIRALAQSRPIPGRGDAQYIPRAQVEAMGAATVKAYDAIGGADRVLGAKGESLSFLAREFAAVYSAEAANA